MKENRIIRINAGELACAILVGRDGVELYSVRDKKTKKNFLTVKRPLITLTARSLSCDETVTVGSESGWRQVAATESGRDTVLVLSENDRLPEVSVIICAHATDCRIEWSVSLVSRNSEYALYECDYPILSFDSGRNMHFFSPCGPGEEWSSLEESRSCQNYPSYGASMQYLAFWNTATRRGVYYGLHDPSPAYKKIFFEKKKNDKFVTLKAIMPLTDIDVGGNSQTLYGSCVWQLFDGDWYEAAMLYREFFLKYAVWKPEINDGGRTDNPDWFKTATHWWRVRMKDDEQYVEDILRANADLEYDSPVHLYDWFVIPYDNDYPHYFPYKDAFYTGVKRLQANGVRVMPYINGRLWDTRDRGMEDFEWSEKAYPNCTKDRGGEPFIEIYSSKEADGSSVRNSIMCPSTACWQEKVTEIVSKLLNEVGVDGVYIDQIAAAQPYPCEDRGHAHRPGGGSWWVESYNNLLDHVSRIMPEGSALSTECTADPFMKHMQAYLTWLWVHNNQVPAFPAIYSRYVTMFGRNYCFMPFDDDEGQRIMIAESLTFGEELGWNDPLLYLQMKHKDFYKKCVHERVKIADYFYNGELMPPVYFEDGLPKIRTEKCREARYGLIEHTACFCQRWRRIDGKELLVIVNAGEGEADFKVKSGLPDGVYRLAGDSSEALVIKGGTGEVRLPPLSVSYSIN